MEFSPIPLGARDSAAVTQPDFGMLRAWIGARQQALPTVRVLAESTGSEAAATADPLTANLALLAGHSPSDPPTGRFANSFACGATCANQGETDA